MGYDSVNSV